MRNTRIQSLKSSLLIAASLLCGASLGTAAQASEARRPPDDGPAAAAAASFGHACVVIRHSGAQVPLTPIHFGHIGWGVEISNGRYLFGAVEGASSNGSAGWSRTGSWAQMLAAFQHPGHTGSKYDGLRCVAVARPNVGAASSAARTMPDRSKHYDLRTKNCLHATYAVIHAYGATGVPAPSGTDIIPNKYYNDFPGAHRWPL
jgi:hypothetical protein